MQLVNRFSKTIVWTLAILPGLIALTHFTGTDFSTPGSLLNILGRLTGIWGLSFLLVAAILCCRVPGFDQPFGGLTKLWSLHHRLGALSFLLLLAHPVLLALAATEISLAAAVATLFSTQSSIIWGWLALLALMVFMAPTFDFFGQPEYQHWKWLHRLSGMTVLFALIHALMLNRSLPISIWALLAFLAVAAISYRWLFSRWHGQKNYRVNRIEHPANNVVELSLEPVDHLLDYAPGQFVYLTAYDSALTNGRGEDHPYTLTSAPDEPALRIAIKALGDASHAIQSIALNSKVKVEGPYGRFFPDSASAPEPEPELWIAGGIGISPFLGRLRHCAKHHTKLNAHLIYCVQDEARLLFGEELSRLMRSLPESRLHVHFFYKEGPLNREFIETHCPDFVRRKAYLCGPIPLTNTSRALLIQGGVAPKHIVTEEFNLL